MTETPARTLDLLSRLIGFDTVSRRSNLGLIEFAADFLAARNGRVSVSRNADGTKANLFATVGPERDGGLLLAGHSDVVPVTGQDWTTDPFRASLRDGHVYGRGTCDMKGFIAVALALLDDLAKEKLSRPVHLALTYDEEVGCFGAAALARLIAQMPARPRFGIVGEPTTMKVVNGHKGKLSLDCSVNGTEGHSAHNDRAVNAVEIAAEIIVRLRAMQKRLAADRRDERFDPPFTTIHTGVIAGGVARNIVPRDCRLEIEIRNIPGEDPETLRREIESFAATELLGEMRVVSPDAGIRFAVQSCIPALSPEAEDGLLQTALSLSGANRPGVVSFATEAGLYQGAGVPSIVCGPGDIRQAHRPDEFVAVSQLDDCALFLRRMIQRFQAT
ncbi:MAG: hypothetical protein RL477_444 [Pseudomonadota bacterium]|jgi:acetylornithine deacetylase